MEKIKHIDSEIINGMERISRRQLMVFFTMTTMYTFYFVANNNLGPAIKSIQDELQMSSSKVGILFTIFTLLFAIGQFTSGYIADRYGPKRVMMIGAIGGAFSNICFGSSNSLTTLCIFWGMNALFLSMGWSSGCRILYSWIPQRQWGLFMGIYNAFSFLGGVIAYPLATWAILRWGWRAAFFVSPLCLILWAILFHFIVTDTPEQVDGSSENDQSVNSEEKPQLSMDDYREVLRNKTIILVSISAVCSQFVRWGLVNWGIKILIEPLTTGGFGLTLVYATMLASLMHWGGALSSIVLGHISDSWFKGERWQSVTIGFAFGFIGLIIFYMVGMMTISQSLTVIVLGLIFFISGGCIQGLQAPLFNMPQSILGERLSGTGTGVINGWSYIGASLSGISLGWIFDSYGFGAGVLLMALISCFGGIVISFVKK